MKISIAVVLMKNIASVSSLIKTSRCCEGQYFSDAIIILPVFSPLWLIIALSGLIVMYICFSSLLCFHFLCYLLLCWSLTWYNQVIPFFGATMFYSIRGSSYFRFAFIVIGSVPYSPVYVLPHPLMLCSSSSTHLFPLVLEVGSASISYRLALSHIWCF